MSESIAVKTIAAEYKVKGLNATIAQLEALDSRLDRSSRGFRNQSNHVRAAEGSIKAYGKRIRSGAIPALTALDKKSRQVGKRLSTLFAGVGVAGGFALFAGAKKAVGVAGDFQLILAQTKAEAGLTVEAIGQVREKALELGRDTLFSTTEAAGGLRELLKAGLSTKQAFQAVGDVIDFSTATTIDFGVASANVTDIMKQYQLQFNDTGRAVDAIAFGQTKASTSAAELSAALAVTGAGARLAGLDIEKTTVLLDLMANVGTKGQTAGFALSRILTKSATLAAGRVPKLAKKALADLGGTVQDQFRLLKKGKGDVVDFIKSIANAQQKQGLTDFQVSGDLSLLFGREPGRELAKILPALRGTKTEYDKVLGEMLSKAKGTTASIARSMIESFKGQQRVFSASVETVFIRIGEKVLPKLNMVLKDQLIPIANKVGAIFENADSLEQGVSDTVAFIKNSPLMKKAGEEIGSIVSQGIKLALDGLWDTLPSWLKLVIGGSIGARFGGPLGGIAGAAVAANVQDPNKFFQGAAHPVKGLSSGNRDQTIGGVADVVGVGVGGFAAFKLGKAGVNKFKSVFGKAGKEAGQAASDAANKAASKGVASASTKAADEVARQGNKLFSKSGKIFVPLEDAAKVAGRKAGGGLVSNILHSVKGVAGKVGKVVAPTAKIVGRTLSPALKVAGKALGPALRVASKALGPLGLVADVVLNPKTISGGDLSPKQVAQEQADFRAKVAAREAKFQALQPDILGLRKKKISVGNLAGNVGAGVPIDHFSVAAQLANPSTTLPALPVTTTHEGGVVGAPTPVSVNLNPNITINGLAGLSVAELNQLMTSRVFRDFLKELNQKGIEEFLTMQAGGSLAPNNVVGG